MAATQFGVSSRTADLLAASMKTGNRKTMHFVSRRKIDSAAVKEDVYLHKGSYAGDWNYDRREGFGSQTYSSGDKYEGGWRDNKPEGRGTYWKWVKVAATNTIAKSKSTAGNLVKVYEGDFYNGKRHGSGRLYLDNGDIYEGTFVSGLREGQGTLKYADGSVYHGQWFQDKRHGQGILITATGDRYIGAWALDKKHGSGQYLYLEKSKIYTGEWIEDVAKCGEMSEMSADERSAGELPGIASSPLAIVAAAAAKASTAALMTVDEYPAATIPPIGLADPEGVLNEAVSRARELSSIAAAASHAGSASSGSLQDDGGAMGGLSMLYTIDAGTLDLSSDEVAQLTAAFRVGDARAAGCLPADFNVLLEVLSALGISAGVEDAQALMRELTDQELEFQASRNPDHDGIVDTISFPVFAACMARLREV